MVAASFVVLSKLQRLKGDDEIIANTTPLRDLKKALGILADFCGDEDRGGIIDWEKSVRDLVKEVEETAQGFGERVEELSALLEKDIVDMVMDKLPEGEYRDRMGENLRKVMAGEVEPPSGIPPGKARKTPVSALERKLERVEADANASGLDRFIAKEEQDAD